MDKQKTYLVDISSAEEVKRVKQDMMPVIRCEYAKSEISLAELLEEAFRLYLRRILAVHE